MVSYTVEYEMRQMKLELSWIYSVKFGRAGCAVNKSKMYSKLMINDDYLLAFPYVALKIKLLYLISQKKDNIAISYEQYFMASSMSIFEESQAIIRINY